MLMVVSAFLFPAATVEEWTEHPDWSGSWEENVELTKMLGFESEMAAGKKYPPGKIQIEFYLSKKAAMAVLGEDKVMQVQQLIARFQQGGHRIVAAGELNFDRPARKEICFVTHHGGETFLWVGDQAEVVTVAKVGFGRGVDWEHDQMILDFGGLIKKRIKNKDGSPMFTSAGYRRRQ